MVAVKVYNVESRLVESVDGMHVRCPVCGCYVSPVLLAVHRSSDTYFCECPIFACGGLFLARDVEPLLLEVVSAPVMEQRSFSSIIRDISPHFSKIFNEAYSAEQMSLMEICGSGYRKSLEFLIKDYACMNKDEHTVERIRRMPLSQCLAENVSDMRVRSVASRAVWLGNDEAHYVRRWKNKDVQDLKDFIDLTVKWIEQEVETERLLREMPD